jgi:hypothetical protein
VTPSNLRPKMQWVSNRHNYWINSELFTESSPIKAVWP